MRLAAARLAAERDRTHRRRHASCRRFWHPDDFSCEDELEIAQTHVSRISGAILMRAGSLPATWTVISTPHPGFRHVDGDSYFQFH